MIFYFCSTRHLDAYYQVSSQLAFGFRRRKRKIDFQDSSHGGHFGFPIGKISAFVCVEVLRPSQPNRVMSSAVSLPNHTFTGQA